MCRTFHLYSNTVSAFSSHHTSLASSYRNKGKPLRMRVASKRSVFIYLTTKTFKPASDSFQGEIPPSFPDDFRSGLATITLLPKMWKTSKKWEFQIRSWCSYRWPPFYRYSTPCATQFHIRTLSPAANVESLTIIVEKYSYFYLMLWSSSSRHAGSFAAFIQ